MYHFQNQSNPISLWLQGGPGNSSLFGLFVENGPYTLIDVDTAVLKNYTWLGSMSLIYFDNPVGTGFSFTENDKGYATNEADVARDLYNALGQFFTLFSEYRNNDFYLTGESYAGKYIPAIGSLLHAKKNESKINLKGVAIGNGLIDPESMIDYSSFLYKISLFDEDQAEIGKKYEEKILNDIKNERYDACHLKWNDYIESNTSFFYNVTGITYYYNFLFDKEPNDFKFFQTYVTNSKSRAALHVGNKNYSSGKDVLDHLKNDMCKSAKSDLIILMENYKVLLYSGQLDIIVASPLTDNMINRLKWKGSEKYRRSKRQIWKVDGKVAGYLKKVKDFYFMIIRDAGHILPYDQPKAAFQMITQFVNDQL